MSNKISIPWYRRNVPKPKQLESDSFGGFDFPDLDKRRKRKPKRDPTPDPTPQPSPQPVRIREAVKMPVIVKINGKHYIEEGLTLTPLFGGNPIANPKKTNNPKKPYQLPELPTPKLPGLPGLSSKPALSVGVPGDEILLKLMATDSSYNKFVKNYNDFSMQFLWEMQNPFIIYEQPSYAQVKKLLKTFDIEKMDSKDVKAYFKDLGVKGKDLNTVSVRFFIYYETLKVGGQIEDIVVPPIKNTTINGLY